MLFFYLFYNLRLKKFMNQLNRAILIGLTLMQCFVGALAAKPYRNFIGSDIDSTKGYKDIICYGDGFIAAGSEGRIDRLSPDGNLVKSETFRGELFTSLLVDGKKIWAAGENGILRVSSGQEPFKKIESGTDETINSLLLFRDKIIGGTDAGDILIKTGEGKFETIHLSVKGNVVSLAARSSECFGVTDAGEVIRSADGLNWSVFDFNQTYSGYYPTCSFSKISVAEDQVAVIGRQENGAPVLMLSNQGNVWTDRPLNYTDNVGRMMYMEEIPLDLTYDSLQDIIILACTKGKILTIPSCSHCNELFEVADVDLYAITVSGNNVIIAGRNYFARVINNK
jgi:hypothetical protein